MSASEQPLLDQVAEDGPLAEREAAAAMLRLTTALIDRVATNGGATSLVPLLNAFPDNVLMLDDGAIKLSNGTRHPSHPLCLPSRAWHRSRDGANPDTSPVRRFVCRHR